MEEKCQRCGEVGQDKRTLTMECFYDMSELGLPFTSFTSTKPNRLMFQLRVCKKCRAGWMKAIKNWFNTPDEPEPNTGYYVQELGTPTQKPIPE